MNATFRQKKLALTRSQRRKIEDAIERLLAILDTCDGDPDTEQNGDDEPWLGWSITGATAPVAPLCEDLELEEFTL